MDNLPQQKFDISEIGSPLHFFGLVAYIASVVVLLIGVQALSAGSPQIAWALILGGLVLVVGVTVAVYTIVRGQHWKLFRPSDLTSEYIAFLKWSENSKELKRPMETQNQNVQELNRILTRLSRNYTHKIVTEIIERFKLSNPSLSTDSPKLAGKWKGLVNGKDQIIEIKQSGTIVYLSGAALSDSGDVDYVFGGEGQVVSNTLIFIWHTGSTSGTNIMTVSSDGNSIEGKYFNQLGASGPERYERIEEANEAKSKPDVAVDKADNEVSE